MADRRSPPKPAEPNPKVNDSSKPENSAPFVSVPLVAVPCFIALENSAFPFAITHQAVLAQMQAAISPISFTIPPAAAPVEEGLTAESKTELTQSVGVKNSGDGFNWRKYGQKQVKGTDNARSYYRCTHGGCSAKKKIEHRQDGHVLEMTYQGTHNHDPPANPRFGKDKKILSIVLPETKETSIVEKRLHCSSDCEAGAVVEEPDQKKRAVEKPKDSPNQVAVVIKPVKEPKIIRHLAADPGALSDGYRWRKYGQKFVKGNPNPRSYYRCTHAGCPARRHVEKDSADADAVIVNYEGNHNHDLPPPRTPTALAVVSPPLSADLFATAVTVVSSPPSADLLVTVAATTEATGQPMPSTPVSDQMMTTKPAPDGSLEQAQTLLSIGGARPIFDDHPPPVSVQNS